MRSGRVRWPFDAISFVVTFQRIVSISNGLNLKCGVDRAKESLSSGIIQGCSSRS